MATAWGVSKRPFERQDEHRSTTCAEISVGRPSIVSQTVRNGDTLKDTDGSRPGRKRPGGSESRAPHHGEKTCRWRCWDTPRVSTRHQSPDMKTKGLTEAGAERIWTGRMSEACDDRPELAALLDHARGGDVLIVWRLDRLG